MDLPTSVVMQNAGFDDVIPPRPATSRDITLLIEARANGRIEITAYNGPVFSEPGLHRGSFHGTEQSLGAAIGELRSTWHRHVLHTTPPGQGAGQPFLDHWDLSHDVGQLQRVGPRLAMAGDQLRQQVFGAGDAGLHHIEQRLSSAMRSRPLVVTIISGDCFVPWGMLYTHPSADGLSPDGANWNPEGFWGLRHLIEHRTPEECFDTMVGDDGEITASLQFDRRLVQHSNDSFIRDVADALALHPGVRIVQRADRDAFLNALAHKPFPDHVAYFCCHGMVSGAPGSPNFETASFTLSDNEPITVGNVEYCLARQRPLTPRPFIFMNMCQGGQMHSLFYRSVARAFLEAGALALVGAHIDVPVVLAPHYAARFFEQLVGVPRETVAESVRSLARELWDSHANPLGLIYAVYRGIDVRVAADSISSAHR